MSFDYTIQRQGETITVTPEGDVSLETTPLLREVLRQVVDSQDGGTVDVDMHRVTFVDSAGIGVLVAAQRAATAKGVELMLIDPGPMIRMVLEISGLDGVLVRPSAESDPV
jgi:anti-anti-sigma factor